MQGYPKFIATKRDYQNLLGMPEFAGRVKMELIKLASTNTAKITRAVRPVDPKIPDGEWITEEIDNPNPVWKQKGFKSIQEVQALASIPGLPPAKKEVRKTEAPVVQDIQEIEISPAREPLGSKIVKGIRNMAKKLLGKEVDDGK